MHLINFFYEIKKNRKVLSWVRKSKFLSLHKKTKKSYLTWENRKVLSCMRKPKNLILHERTEKSYLAWENWKALSYMRNTDSLIRNMEDAFLPNVPNFCLTSQMSAQCNVPNIGLMFYMSPIICPNVPNFCPMLFAVKSRISLDMFKVILSFSSI
jgi:hypothetical protein